MIDHDADELAQHALALQAKLARLCDDLDPVRAALPGSRWALVAQVHEPLARAHMVARVFADELSPWPELIRLSERAPRVALLDRHAMVRSLALLALAGRPGALRCCIDRVARDGLRELLGHAFEPLSMRLERGRAAPAGVAAWTPLHWASLGYIDWTSLMQPGDRPLQRLVQLSLPQGLLGMRAKHAAFAAEMPAPRALALIDELGLEWPC